MASIERFIVTQPPTGGEVRDLGLIAQLMREPFRLTLRSEAEVPRPTDVAVEFLIKQTLQPDEGGMIFGGEIAPGEFITVQAVEDRGLPATATKLMA